MPFRIWFYLAQVGGPILFAVIFFTFSAPKDSLLGHIRVLAFCLLVPLAIMGAVMGLIFALGKLRMRCPFCGKPGRIGVSKSDGMWMECETCGFVHGSGPLRLKIIKEEIEKDEDDVA
jgi:hypothetical protein